jgi:peptide/nickel transport system permease protein
MRYVLRRLGFYLLAAFTAITVNFFIPRLAPGNPVSVMVASYPGTLTPGAVESLKSAYGVTDEPLWRQYLAYLGDLAHGDLGVSLSNFPSPVGSVIGSAIGYSVLLGGVALIVSFTIGTGLGALVAWRRTGALDRTLPPTLIFLGSFPYFFLALLLVWQLALGLGWFPLGRAYGRDVFPGWSWEFAASLGQHLALPALTIVLVTMGGWCLNMRNAMIGVLSEDHLTLAEAKGLRPGLVVRRHAIRNALLPSVTMLGAAAGAVFSGQILTEVVFSYPGLGFMLLQAVNKVDYPLMQGLFLIITLAVLAANFTVDSIYALLDPRVRIEARG